MNRFIFDILCRLKENSNEQAIKSISIEVKYIDAFSRFYLSILLNDNLNNEMEYDEIVVEINSDDGIFFDMDLSDSSGFVYMEDHHIDDKEKIVDFLEKAKNKFPSIFTKLLKT